jgi:hypothetical protein
VFPFPVRPFSTCVAGRSCILVMISRRWAWRCRYASLSTRDGLFSVPIVPSLEFRKEGIHLFVGNGPVHHGSKTAIHKDLLGVRSLHSSVRCTSERHIGRASPPSRGIPQESCHVYALHRVKLAGRSADQSAECQWFGQCAARTRRRICYGIRTTRRDSHLRNRPTAARFQ